MNSSIDETVGRIGQLQKQLQESQQRIDQRFADYQREVRTQLAQTQMDASEFRNKLQMADFDLGNYHLTGGRHRGRIEYLHSGGVVGAGDHLMDVYPAARHWWWTLASKST